MEEQTMSNAFIYRMPGGIAGDVTRREHATIVPEIMDATTPVTLYGVPVKLVTGKVKPIASGDTLSSVAYGLLVRPFPGQVAASEAIGAGTPSIVQPADILKRGYMTVVCNLGTPAKNGIVYVRKTAHDTDTTAYPIGGIEAAADSSKCEALPGGFFVGTGDADGNVEIAYNI
jgi:hypothetical protein